MRYPTERVIETFTHANADGNLILRYPGSVRDVTTDVDSSITIGSPPSGHGTEVRVTDMQPNQPVTVTVKPGIR